MHKHSRDFRDLDHDQILFFETIKIRPSLPYFYELINNHLNKNLPKITT